MAEETAKPPNPRDALKLKLPEAEVSLEQPWDDDVLNRAQIAARLTNLLQNQSSPFVISIHGYWGTGKTFLLKRWQKDLETQGFKAIYLNAWEDDFCDDPLLAILGQLAEYFQEGQLKGLARQILDVAAPLIWQNISGVLNKATGINLQVPSKEQSERDFIQEYLDQRATKDKLKKHLERMSAAVNDATGRPMVFIIDELDRCRPTFAIELLERVKHIFDVRNVVFVFGINRDELCSSLQSIYGNIDADVYLRRFFDMEFTLPQADSEKFARYLIGEFGLTEFFGSLATGANDRVHVDEFQRLSGFFPSLWRQLDLSLRDIDYCVRLLSLVGKNLKPREYMFPGVLGLLITLKLKNLDLYRKLVQGSCHVSEVVDYIDGELNQQVVNGRLRREMNRIEAHLYFGEHSEAGSGPQANALSQLRLLKDGSILTHPEYLSKRTREAGKEEANELLTMAESNEVMAPPGEMIGYAAELIDLHQGFVRR